MKKYKNILRRLDELEARIGKVENRCKAMDDVFEDEGGLMEYLAEVFPEKSKFEKEVEQ